MKRVDAPNVGQRGGLPGNKIFGNVGKWREGKKAPPEVDREV